MKGFPEVKIMSPIIIPYDKADIPIFSKKGNPITAQKRYRRRKL